MLPPHSLAGSSIGAHILRQHDGSLSKARYSLTALIGAGVLKTRCADPAESLAVGDADSICDKARKRASFMPLELFDDHELESRTPQEWVALGAESGGPPAASQWNSLRTGVAEQRSVKVRRVEVKGWAIEE